MTLVIFDDKGVVHAVYNADEVRKKRESDAYVENWEVRTLCDPDHDDMSIDSDRVGVTRAVLDESERAGHQVTCVRCLAIPCDHGIRFDLNDAQNLGVSEIRRRYPRLSGPCPKGCGYNGIYYDSHEHYVYGDW